MNFNRNYEFNLRLYDGFYFIGTFVSMESSMCCSKSYSNDTIWIPISCKSSYTTRSLQFEASSLGNICKLHSWNLIIWKRYTSYFNYVVDFFYFFFQIDGTILAALTMKTNLKPNIFQWLNFKWLTGFTIRGSGTVNGQWSQFQNLSLINEFQVRLDTVYFFCCINEITK